MISFIHEILKKRDIKIKEKTKSLFYKYCYPCFLSPFAWNVYFVSL